MVDLLSEIEWHEPLFPSRSDSEFEKEFSARFGGNVPEIYRRVSDVPWLREFCIKIERLRPVFLSPRMMDIGAMVTAQENSCRYCYGATRASMRTLGYSERMISQIERDVQVAGLNELERAFISFCRNLARSNPRPSGKERKNLLELGFSPQAIAEMAAWITGQCFMNRVATIIAAPPLHDYEKMAESLFVRLMRPLLALKPRNHHYVETGAMPEEITHFPHIINALKNLPMAPVLYEALQSAFSPSRLSLLLKLLMFSVVALSLNCKFCQMGVKEKLIEEGLDEEEINTCLSTLTSPRLTPAEENLLAWTRETVHFQAGFIQKRTRELAQEIDQASLLEAIGIASLANSVVRLAVLLEE